MLSMCLAYGQSGDPSQIQPYSYRSPERQSMMQRVILQCYTQQYICCVQPR